MVFFHAFKDELERSIAAVVVGSFCFEKIINIGYLFYICRNQSDHFVRYFKQPRTTTMAQESQFVAFSFS